MSRRLNMQGVVMHRIALLALAAIPRALAYADADATSTSAKLRAGNPVQTWGVLQRNLDCSRSPSCICRQNLLLTAITWAGRL